MKQVLQKIIEKRNLMDMFFLLCLALILSIPNFNSHTDIYLDDGSQHLMRAYGTYQAIKQDGTGNVIFDFANEFGYSWNLFYGPLSAYSVILFGIIFGSFNIGFKMVFGLVFFLSRLVYV